MQEELFALLASRKGHFLLESGHHGELWLDLETLCLRPGHVRPFAVELARRLARHRIEVVCGPLVEGAFVALMVADELGVPFTYSERIEGASRDGLFPVQYRIPRPLRQEVRGQRVAIVNDVINAGSAVRGTFADLVACDARPVALGSLLVMGGSASDFASDKNLTLEAVESRANSLWVPSECPLCASGVPLEDVPGFRGDS